MDSNQQILSKGFYQYAQIGNPVSVIGMQGGNVSSHIGDAKNDANNTYNECTNKCRHNPITSYSSYSLQTLLVFSTSPVMQP